MSSVMCVYFCVSQAPPSLQLGFHFSVAVSDDCKLYMVTAKSDSFFSGDKDLSFLKIKEMIIYSSYKSFKVFMSSAHLGYSFEDYVY